MGRAPCCDKANVKRGPWSPEEDATLKAYLEKHGNGGNWIALPSKAGLNRCGKSCRLRWLNYLRPDIKHGGFTEQEDITICTLYSSIGSRWSVIASQLPGRTDNDVKNYWNTKLKKKLLTGRRRNNDVNNSNTNNDCHSGTDCNLPQFSASIQKPEAYIPENSPGLDATSCILPTLMELGYQQSCDPQVLILDQVQLLHPSDLTHSFPKFGTSTECNSYSISPSQEVSSLSTLSPIGLENNQGSWPGNGSVVQEGGTLMEFGYESPNYALLEGFDFSDKCTDQVAPCLGNPPFID